MSPRTKFATAVLTAAVLAVTGCGNDSAAPIDGKIEIVLNELPITVGAGGGCIGIGAGGTTIFEVIFIIVTDGDGRRMGKVELDIQVDWAANDFTGVEVIRLFDDKNSDGIPDATELVSGVGSSLLIPDAKTDETGTKQVIMQREVTPGCTFAGNFVVVSGPLSAIMTYENT